MQAVCPLGPHAHRGSASSIFSRKVLANSIFRFLFFRIENFLRERKFFEKFRVKRRRNVEWSEARGRFERKGRLVRTCPSLAYSHDLPGWSERAPSKRTSDSVPPTVREWGHHGRSWLNSPTDMVRKCRNSAIFRACGGVDGVGYPMSLAMWRAIPHLFGLSRQGRATVGPVAPHPV